MRKYNPYNFIDKEYIVKQHKLQCYNKLLSMFHYENLPDTIPQVELEKILLEGFACVAEYEGNLYAFTGGLGGVPDVYYRPTVCTVANPALNISKDYIIDKECIIIKNDSYLQGVNFIVDKFSAFIAENEITLHLADINNRISVILSAGDNKTRASAEEYINNIEKGKQSTIVDNAFLESLKLHNNNYTNNALKDTITENQYLRACFLNDIGLQANTQLKKERLVSAEVEINTTSLYPFVDNMLHCRQEGIDKVNNMFGTNIKVEFTSSWDYRVFGGANIENPVNVELPPSDNNNTLSDDNEEV